MTRISKKEPDSLTDLATQVEALCDWLQDSYSVAVEALILSKDHKLLLLERGKLARDENGKLEGVGGRVEAEKLRPELLREVYEEIGTGIQLSNIRFLELKNDVIADSGKRWVIASYICDLKTGKPHICEPGKVDAIHWVDYQKVEPNRLTSSCMQSIKSLRKILAVST